MKLIHGVTTVKQQAQNLREELGSELQVTRLIVICKPHFGISRGNMQQQQHPGLDMGAE
jgi:uncharacterized protein (DUF302 family)